MMKQALTEKIFFLGIDGMDPDTTRRLVNEGKVHLRPLISKTFAFKDYLKAYQYIDDNRETTMKVIINVQEQSGDMSR